jgi:hypothetical protein
LKPRTNDFIDASFTNAFRGNYQASYLNKDRVVAQHRMASHHFHTRKKGGETSHKGKRRSIPSPFVEATRMINTAGNASTEFKPKILQGGVDMSIPSFNPAAGEGNMQASTRIDSQVSARYNGINSSIRKGNASTLNQFSKAERFDDLFVGLS